MARICLFTSGRRDKTIDASGVRADSFHKREEGLMASYRVFRPAGEQLTLPNGVQLEESYPAFDVVSGTTEAISALRQQYPVEELPELAARQPSGRTALAAAAGEPV